LQGTQAFIRLSIIPVSPGKFDEGRLNPELGSESISGSNTGSALRRLSPAGCGRVVGNPDLQGRKCGLI